MAALRQFWLRLKLAYWMATNAMRYPLDVLVLCEYTFLLHKGAQVWTVSVTWDTGDVSSAAGFRSLPSALRQLNEDRNDARA